MGAQGAAAGKCLAWLAAHGCRARGVACGLGGELLRCEAPHGTGRLLACAPTPLAAVPCDTALGLTRSLVHGAEHIYDIDANVGAGSRDG